MERERDALEVVRRASRESFLIKSGARRERKVLPRRLYRVEEVRSCAAFAAVRSGMNKGSLDYLIRHVLETIFGFPGREGERRDG
jgi:hypothetical protein